MVATLIQSCEGVCQRLEERLNDNNNFILHRRKWVCLSNSYSFLLDKISQHLNFERNGKGHTVTHCSKEPPPQTDKIALALNEILQTVEKGERFLHNCCLQNNYIDVKVFQNWLVNSALHLSTSTDLQDTYLSELLWCYSVFHMALRQTVLISTNYEGRHKKNEIINILNKEMNFLNQIWTEHSSDEDKDAQSALAFLKDSLLKLGNSEDDEQSRTIVQFIIQKWSTHVENTKPGNVSITLPKFMWRNIGEINVQDCLGAGGYGLICKVNWMGGFFAVKIFSYVEDPEGILGTEAAIQARLSHPNVEHLICCAWDPSSFEVYIMMELMEQADLMSFMLKRRKAGFIPPFSLIEAVDLMLQIAKGMEYLHSLGIMHRDLKSPNILVRTIPEKSETTKKIEIHLKITDFGMSKRKLASSKYSSRPVGTRGWRAPEVFKINPVSVMKQSQARKYTKKADVYSFAIVCFEILSGKPPYDKDHESQLESKVMNGERPILPEDCPLVLKDLIQECWHRDPLQRPSFTQICKTLRYLKACIVLGSINDLILAPQPHDCDGEEQLKLKQLLIPIEICNLHKMEELEGFQGEELVNHLVNLFTRSGRGTAGNGSIIGTQCETWATREQIQSILKFCPRFSYKQLREATSNFGNMVGEGMFASVYEGELPDKTKIAVRRSNCEKYGPAQYFLTELAIISKMPHHPNLVQLRGCCLEDHHRLFAVYEFVSNSSLDKWLFAERDSEHLLDWDMRCKIAIGTARGVEYLHKLKIIHRNINPRNILLDEDFNAKVSNFCLAVAHDGCTSLYLSFVKLCLSSDVYSFGVTLLEIISGRKTSLHIYNNVLVKFAFELLEKGLLEDLIDERLKGSTRKDDVIRMTKIALWCTQEDSQLRPSMTHVVQMLKGETIVYDPPPSSSSFWLKISGFSNFLF